MQNQNQLPNKPTNKSVNKSKFLRRTIVNVGAIAGTGVIASCSLLSLPSANAQNISNLINGNGFLRNIEELRSQTNQKLQDIVGELTNRWSKVPGEISTKIQAGVETQIQSKIDDFIGDLGLPDLIKAGDKIEETISSVNTDISQLNPVVKGKHARSELHRTYTLKQVEGVIGVEGQKIMKQKSEVTQAAADISVQKAESAQGDYITQDIMKKIAAQNAQNSTILKIMQSSLQEQKQLTATANVNLTDISQSLAIERLRRQKEEQGSVNAIYQNAVFSDQLWNRSGQ